jgi:hypothetical protein
MPASTTAVTVDDMFEALHRLGSPSVFYDEGGDLEPGDDVVPELIGVLMAAVERLMVQREAPSTPAKASALVSGYLQALGAGTPCGAAQTFDMLTVRLQMTAMLLHGYGGDQPMAALLNATVNAAACFAIAAATGQHGNEPGRDTKKMRATAGEQLATGQLALDAAAAALTVIRDRFEQAR